MDKINKALKKLNKVEREKVKMILLLVDKGDFINLDVKKLKGKNNFFRIRKGNIRIIFYKIKNSIKVLTIEKRGSRTYNKKQ